MGPYQDIIAPSSGRACQARSSGGRCKPPPGKPPRECLTPRPQDRTPRHSSRTELSFTFKCYSQQCEKEEEEKEEEVLSFFFSFSTTEVVENIFA